MDCFPFETVPFQVTCSFGGKGGKFWWGPLEIRREKMLVEDFLRGSMCVTRHQVAKPC